MMVCEAVRPRRSWPRVAGWWWRAVLLNAHYDSTPAGPGAADDGIGVATLLEVGSVLQHQPLKRPVILLFNEGEEYGLNGAAAFEIRIDPGHGIGVDLQGDGQ